MEAHVRRLLETTLTVDLTTIGRNSGRPSTVEIWAWWFEDRYLITGTPGPRDWLANILADPTVFVDVQGNRVAGRARVVDDLEIRRRFFETRQASWYSTQAELDHLVRAAPMIEITFV